ncbi:M24 family metallopeptidase [Paenibacillus qinlingensis]|uniref:Xaa-Pro aminopeptidase n=1 Tax=Paenibacillus qinlingensis TaxID=1837343 RepID=A0ABU1NSI2_9BACL|nr:M24 family metallopeptidase [Paenibacillus qinlingensis]MDR6550440.1 Xaa-Pro aminopeptidase [Paenibacillus qinlingensis]
MNMWQLQKSLLEAMAECEEVLDEGIVVCIEPGIYLEGAGVRIENMYVVRADG